MPLSIDYSELMAINQRVACRLSQQGSTGEFIRRYRVPGFGNYQQLSTDEVREALMRAYEKIGPCSFVEQEDHDVVRNSA